MNYRNPVISGFHPDPSICRSDDDYFLVTSSFEYFPGVPLFHSKDLVHWEQIGHCLTRPEQLDLQQARSSGGIYAPTIRYHNGIYYMVTTNVSAGGNFYVYTKDPRGEWSNPVYVDQPGIDPDLFFDEDGSVYFSTAWGNSETGTGIYQSRINIESGKRLTDYTFVWQGTGGQYPEAPHLYHIGDWYYLLIAEGGTEYGHMVTISRSEKVTGPFEACPHNPILTHRSQLKSIHATGHADLVQTSEGSWWAIFLAIRPVGYPKRHHLGRETFLAPVSWTADGWPIIGDNGTVSEVMSAQELTLQPKVHLPIRDDFNTGKLASHWNLLRSPNTDTYSLKSKESCLTLYGSAETLDDCGTPAFVGRRQQHFACEASTQLTFDPQQDGEEAGITVYMNERFHYELAVKRISGERKLIFRRRLGSLWKVENEMPLSADSVILTVRADKWHYYFEATIGARNTTAFGQGECALLATEVAGGFTGVFIAMYATGNGANSISPAHYDWFDYEGTESSIDK